MLAKDAMPGRPLAASTGTSEKNSGAPKNKAIYWGDKEWNLILNIMLGIQKARLGKLLVRLRM